MRIEVNGKLYPLIFTKLTKEKDQQFFYCEKCKRNHYHGVGNGFRTPHCYGYGEYKDILPDYYLILDTN